MRQAQDFCEEFSGLDKETNRYDLLRLVKKVGRLYGFSPRMIELLDYYMAFTREIDWQEGGRPIVYQSLSKTALDLGVSERQIQKLEKLLFEQGALTWNDSGNHRRYGQRDEKTGVILYAYGVDLTPLAALRAELELKLLQKEEHDRLWMETKRQISWYRRQIKALFGEIESREGASIDLREFEHAYNEIGGQIRTHMNLETLYDLLGQHKSLHALVFQTVTLQSESSNRTYTTLKNRLETEKGSSISEQKFVHYNYTTYKKSDKSDTRRAKQLSLIQGVVADSVVPELQENKLNSTLGVGNRELYEGTSSKFSQNTASNPGKSVVFSPDTSADAVILATGLQHITMKQALNAASSRFKDHIPVGARPMCWNDLVEAAYALKRELGISQKSWADACLTLGRSGAAVCVLLTDNATQREDNPVTKPAAYFYAMINRAHAGELHLHNSIFGILKKEDEE
jgi:hypothetical protein